MGHPLYQIGNPEVKENPSEKKTEMGRLKKKKKQLQNRPGSGSKILLSAFSVGKIRWPWNFYSRIPIGYFSEAKPSDFLIWIWIKNKGWYFSSEFYKDFCWRKQKTFELFWRIPFRIKINFFKTWEVEQHQITSNFHQCPLFFLLNPPVIISGIRACFFKNSVQIFLRKTAKINLIFLYKPIK